MYPRRALLDRPKLLAMATSKVMSFLRGSDPKFYAVLRGDGHGCPTMLGITVEEYWNLNVPDTTEGPAKPKRDRWLQSHPQSAAKN